MIKRRIFILLLCLHLVLPAHSGTGPIYPVSKEDIPGISITRNEIFAGTGLWGYIDGGADVYMEYGFEAVYVEELTWQDEPFLVEIYEMSSSEAAFGIFSISAFRCIAKDTLSVHDCLSKYQYQLAHGNLYISVINRSGTIDAQRKCTTIGKILGEKNPREAYEFPGFPGQEKMGEEIQSLYYVRGPLGLQNAVIDWSDLFEGIGFEMFIYSFAGKPGVAKLAQIRFSSFDDKNRFIQEAGFSAGGHKSEVAKDAFRQYREISPQSILFLESNTQDYLDFLFLK